MTTREIQDPMGSERPIRHLLAVCDGGAGDRATLEAALTLSDAWNAQLSTLVVAEAPGELDRLADLVGISRAEGEARMTAACRAHVETLIGELGPGRAPDIHVRIGKPFLETVRHVLERDIDLVVKQAEDLTGVGRHLFASTDQHLLRKCPCPVWLRRGTHARALPAGTRVARTILAAVDVDEAVAREPETLRGLNDMILKTAAAMAEVDGATVHVLHVWDAPSEGLVQMWSWDNFDESVVHGYMRRMEMAHRQALDALVTRARETLAPGPAARVSFKPALVRGVARETIVREVSMRSVDLLVMGTIARTGVPGFIIGNTAEDTLNCVECPVVTVKPPGYVSPVAGMGAV